MVRDHRPAAIPRHELLAAALQLGIAHPESLSETELANRIREVSESEGQTASSSALGSTGWLAVARHLVTSIVEQGLNLPTAARALRESMRPRSGAPQRPPLPTVTLAQIYMSQGHDSRAREVLEQVLERVPNHAKARVLLDRLNASASPEEVAAVEAAAQDALVVLQTSDRTLLYWELGVRAERARRRGEALELDIATFLPRRSGAVMDRQRVDIASSPGSYELSCDPGVVVRAALGSAVGDKFRVLSVASAHFLGPNSEQPSCSFRPRKGLRDADVVERARALLTSRTD